MGQFEKLLISILCGSKDSDIRFGDLCKVLETLGFQFRQKGNHHIFYQEDVHEIINIQPDGAKAKPYQAKQVMQIIVNYKLGGDIDA